MRNPRRLPKPRALRTTNRNKSASSRIMPTKLLRQPIRRIYEHNSTCRRTMGRRRKRKSNRHSRADRGLRCPRDGRQQCGTHGGERRQNVQTASHTERYTLPRHRKYHRQRRSSRSESGARRNEFARSARRQARQAFDRSARARGHAVPQGDRRACRACKGQKRHRHYQARHRSVVFA